MPDTADMKVNGLTAEANAAGGRIDLVWTTPSSTRFRGVKLLRRERAFPEVGPHGALAGVIHDEPASSTPAGTRFRFSDAGLKSETHYYYAVVAYDDAGTPNYFPAFVSATATGVYDSGAQLYESLPALYRYYDTRTPPDVAGVAQEDKSKGQLLRLLEMFGSQLDLLRSYAAGMRNFHDLAEVEPALLPLLAQWVGWRRNASLPLPAQRNEVRFATHFYRAKGVPASVLAAVGHRARSRVQLKEYVHNVQRTNDPARLAVWEHERVGGVWGAPRLVTVDVAYDGKPAAVEGGDGRQFLFYHARAAAPLPATPEAARNSARDLWHVWLKTRDEGAWSPARRVTFDGKVNRHPAAFRKADGSLWLFWTAYAEVGGGLVARLRQKILSTGRAAAPAVLRGARREPFALGDGNTLTVLNGAASRTVVFRREDFRDIAQAKAAEVAAVLQRELPGVEAFADAGSVVLRTQASGQSATLSVTDMPASSALGFKPGATAAGRDASRARLTAARSEPYNIAAGSTLALALDDRAPVLVTFRATDFQNALTATAAEVAAAVNRALPGAAEASGGRLVLVSPTAGASSFVSAETWQSTAAAVLGFGAQPPAPAGSDDDTEPAAFTDTSGRVWLFWSSRRAGAWRVWYSRFDAPLGRWDTPKALSSGPTNDREPSVVFDPATGGGKFWVFWTGQKANGRRNIFYATATGLDFNSQTWTAQELAPVPGNYDRCRPSAVLASAERVELYFDSNQTDGWDIWSRAFAPAPASADVRVTTGQFAHQGAAALALGGQDVRLWYRSNESVARAPALYPTAEVLDARNSGSLTVDTRNLARSRRRGSPDEIEHYTYDTSRGAGRLYARDVVGFFVTPPDDAPATVERERRIIGDVLDGVLPANVRPVIIVLPASS
ncbi:MAG: phage tail protein [Pyrinomonadaceae bacterium]